MQQVRITALSGKRKGDIYEGTLIRNVKIGLGLWLARTKKNDEVHEEPVAFCTSIVTDINGETITTLNSMYKVKEISGENEWLLN